MKGATPECTGLADEIVQYIRSDATHNDSDFNALVLRIFEYQTRNNPFLARYLQLSRISAPSHYTEIPAVPTNAFKRADLRSFPHEEEIACFQTSGTTSGMPGRHHFRTLELYEAAILPNFRRYLLPDTTTMRMLVLTPSSEEAPHSSLSYMMKTVVARFGTPDSRFLFSGGDLQCDTLFEILNETTSTGQPVFLSGTAFAFAHMLDMMDAAALRYALPPGSRIMETGGFKGRTREMPREEFYPRLSQSLGIPECMIVNEYGMTELSSQFYDGSIALGTATDWKQTPHWTRVSAIDPLTRRPAPDGVRGILRILDLANLGSVVALQTEDVGITRGSQFRVLGRHQTASPRGCSLGAEEALQKSAQGLRERPS